MNCSTSILDQTLSQNKDLTASLGLTKNSGRDLKIFIAMQDGKDSSQFHSQIFCFFTIVNLQ